MFPPNHYKGAISANMHISVSKIIMAKRSEDFENGCIITMYCGARVAIYVSLVVVVVVVVK